MRTKAKPQNPLPSLAAPAAVDSGESRPIRPGLQVRIWDADGTAWTGVVQARVRRVRGCRLQVVAHQPGTQWPVLTEDECGKPVVRFALAKEMEVVCG